MAGLLQDVSPTAEIYIAEITQNWNLSEEDLDKIANVSRFHDSCPPYCLFV